MGKLLLDVEALTFLEKQGFPILKTAIANDAKNAARIASGFGFPVALKISSPDVIHKTEEQGVRLFLNSEDEVQDAFRSLAGRFTSQSPDKRFDGVMVQRMGSGLELIVGSLNDQQFGPVLMFGLGGIFAEAMKDTTFRLIPIQLRDAKEMINDLRAARVLTNPREEAFDLTIIEDLLLRISRLIEEHSEIQEMDLNPVFVSARGIEICDARLKLRSL